MKIVRNKKNNEKEEIKKKSNGRTLILIFIDLGILFIGVGKPKIKHNI